MPKFYFNVKVKHTGQEVEEDLGKFGKIKTKVEELGLYCIECSVGIENVKEEYNRIKSGLEKRPYVSNVKDSSRMELLDFSKH